MRWGKDLFCFWKQIRGASPLYFVLRVRAFLSKRKGKKCHENSAATIHARKIRGEIEKPIKVGFLRGKTTYICAGPCQTNTYVRVFLTNCFPIPCIEFLCVSHQGLFESAPKKRFGKIPCRKPFIKKKGGGYRASFVFVKGPRTFSP